MVLSYCHCTCRIPLFLLIILYISTFVTAKDYYPAQNTETKGKSLFFRVHFEKHGREAVIKEIRKNNLKLPVRKENYFSCFAWEKILQERSRTNKNKKILPESEWTLKASELREILFEFLLKYQRRVACTNLYEFWCLIMSTLHWKGTLILRHSW